MGVKSPATMTAAKGRRTSEPDPDAYDIGMRVKMAIEVVINTVRNRS